jgi:hypothetical protein
MLQNSGIFFKKNMYYQVDNMQNQSVFNQSQKVSLGFGIRWVSYLFGF